MTEPSTTLYCANHPTTETLLRCNRCEKPICSKCAVQTPTGYRCRECVRGQQKVFETAKTLDLPLAFAVASIISFLGSLIAGSMGFFVIFIAPIVGTIVAEAARFVTRRRRSQQLFWTVAAGALVGALPIPLLNLLGFIFLFLTIEAPISPISASIFGLIWQGIYLVTVTTTAYYRMKGIFLSR